MKSLTQDKNNEILGPIALRAFNLKPQQTRNIQNVYGLGHNKLVDNSNLQDLTTFGEDYITQPTTLIAMEVASDSIEDDTGGTGAINIRVWGLGTNWEIKQQTIVLNGTTAVTTDATAATIEFLRVTKMHVIEPSPTNALHVAVGNITLQTVGGGTVYGKIDAGGNMELAARATVPAGFTGYVTGWNASVGDLPNTGDEVAVFLRMTIDPVLRTKLDNVYIFQDVVHLTENSATRNFDPPFVIPEKAEIKLSAILNGGNGTAVVSGSARGYLVPNH